VRAPLILVISAMWSSAIRSGYALAPLHTRWLLVQWHGHMTVGNNYPRALRCRIWSRVTWGHPGTKGQALSNTLSAYGFKPCVFGSWLHGCGRVVYLRRGLGLSPGPFPHQIIHLPNLNSICALFITRTTHGPGG
jgi:hypothetical protein